MTTTAADYRLPASLAGTILEQIMGARLPEIMEAKVKFPSESIAMALDRAPRLRSLRQTLLRRPGIIAEIKKASPSAGLLRSDFDPAGIARAYLKSGAAALSVVTEATYFQGSLEILASLRWRADLPLLRKDFIVDAYQIQEARLAGADAVLLIASLLPGASLRELRICAEDLGMDALVEVHTEAELEHALESGAGLIGVNNRDLRSFEVSLDVCRRLAPLLPRDAVAVAESGLRSPDDVRSLVQAGFRGFLIGEPLMRSSSPGKALAEFVSALGAAA